MILPPLRAMLRAEALQLLLLALAYGLLSAVTQAYFTPSGDATSASLVWPASGLALAALLIGGARLWPAILFAKVACNLWGGQVLAAALLGGVGSSAAALLGCWLLHRTPGFDARLTRPRDFLGLALVAVLSPAPSALLGAGGLWLFGELPGAELAACLLGWWQGDALGVLLAAPLLLVWREAPAWRWRQQGIEIAACLALALILGYQVLQAPTAGMSAMATLTYLPFLPLGWAALRFGRHGAVLVLTLLAVFALLGVVQGYGAFAGQPTERGLLQLWLYLLVLTSVGLSLALVFHHAKVAMARLAESEERFRLLAAFAPVGIYQTDAEGACTYSNSRWQEISGISAEQTLGEGWSAVVHPDDRDAVLQGWRATAAEHREYAMDFRLLRSDGEVRYLRSRARRLFAEHGPSGGFVGTIDDISEHTRNEAALREAKERLEEHVAERTAELTRAMCEQQQAEAALARTAEELRMAYRRLASTQEYEFRRLTGELHDRVSQSLTAIGLNLNVIARELPPDTPASARERLQDSGQLLRQASQRVRNLMAELQPPMLADFGLPAALRWWADELGRRAPLQVHLAGEESLPRLPGEMEAQLFRIAQEAMMNIVKHASATRIDIALSSGRGRVCLRIEDNGRGFDPGGHDPLLRRPSWGLVHMRERALAIDGELRIESRPDAGTRVEIEAPLP